MKTIRKRKQTYASYKGWHIVQTPWQPYDREFQTAKRIFNPQGQLVLRASYGGKALNHKQLRLRLMREVDEGIPTLLDLLKFCGNKEEK